MGSSTAKSFCVAMIVAAGVVAPAQAAAAGSDRSSGLELFLATGCGACHRIAGTAANGQIGPELTHFAARGTIGANLLPLSRANVFDWIRRTQSLKPGARMPSFDMLPDSETALIVDYLMTLK